MTQLVDDRLLGSVLLGDDPPRPGEPVFITGYWYVRLCQAVLNASERPCVLSQPFAAQLSTIRQRAVSKVLQLPAHIGLETLRTLSPVIGCLRQHHRLNALGIEALAAAAYLRADVFLSTASPQLQEALLSERESMLR